MSDPRLTPANARVAHIGLKGKVAAPRYAQGTQRCVIAPVADLRRAPGGGRDKQMLYGQAFTLLEEHKGWAFGFDGRDGYCGYLPVAALGPEMHPTHRVSCRSSHVYSKPDIKAPERFALSYFSAVRGETVDGGFLELDSGGFVPVRHLAPLGAGPVPDPVTIAEMFLGTPYLWGGNSAWGIDCSGLVQLALWAAGQPCPRDSDLQMQIGPPVRGPHKRGDLVFWAGHVAVMADAETIIHANAHHMAVVAEPLDEAVRRIEAGGGGAVLTTRRPADAHLVQGSARPG